jgi:hypothetical protein
MAVMITIDLFYCHKEFKEKEKKWQEKMARKASEQPKS